MQRIEFGELVIGELARKNLMDVCDTNWASMGPKVKAFEEKWGSLFGYKDSVAVSSGTDSCINACLAVYDLHPKAKRGDEIIVPALSFIATSNAVRAAGFVPRFVDVSKETLNIDVDKLEYNGRVRAIMPVHTMGRPAEMDRILEFADQHNLIVIEDACEAHGAKYKDKFIGTMGDMACFSYYIAHLVCCGEGGMVSAMNKEAGDILRSTRSHGRPFNSIYFDHQRTGLNSKMNDLEASIGLEAIECFWDTFNKRHKIMKDLRASCEGNEDLAWFSEEDEGNINCPHGFSVTMKDSNKINIIKDTFDEYNIHWKRNFGCIPTQHKAFSGDLNCGMGSFPNSEWIGDNGIHIGCHQHLTEENVERIKDALKTSFERARS
tara:strand:+ start:19804 stop:20937 length:1134 start_codon:yes stop_codon:yes gene_type:complete